MNRLFAIAAASLAGIIVFTTPVSAQSTNKAVDSSVSSPPDSFFDLVRERDRDAARKFYKKYIDVRACRSWRRRSRMIGAAAHARDRHAPARRPARCCSGDGRRTGMYLIIIGKDQVYTDMPEYRNHPEPGLSERARARHGRQADQLWRREPAQPADRSLRRREHRRA